MRVGQSKDLEEGNSLTAPNQFYNSINFANHQKSTIDYWLHKNAALKFSSFILFICYFTTLVILRLFHLFRVSPRLAGILSLTRLVLSRPEVVVLAVTQLVWVWLLWCVGACRSSAGYAFSLTIVPLYSSLPIRDLTFTVTEHVWRFPFVWWWPVIEIILSAHI